jgi:aspartate-semialdehyde dehydrogenase
MGSGVVMRICILGATGLVGRETIDLTSRAWPAAELVLFASRDQELKYGDKTYPVRAAASLESADAPRGDLAFVALDDEHSKRYVPRLLELSYRVIDKSNTFRADPKVPLVAAGVNHDLVTDEARLVANPNCTTIPLVLALWPLHLRFGLSSATVSTYQAVSGGGIGPLDQFLDASRLGYSEPDRFGLRFDPKTYAGNTVPHNGNTDASGFSSEERKLVFESRKILRLPSFGISAQCCRVSVAVGHYENAWVTFDKPVSLEDVQTVLGNEKNAPFIRFFPGSTGDGLSALSCVHDRDRTLVGRVRHDERDANHKTLCITVISDNLRLGAATNAVRIASRWFKSNAADLTV